MKNEKITGGLLLLFAMFSVSFIGVFSRKLECSDMSVQLLRAVFAVGGFALIFGLRDGKAMFLPLPSKKEIYLYCLYAASILCASFFFLMAFRHTTFANTIIIHYLTPFVVIMAGAIFLKEPAGRRHILAAMIGVVGIWLGVAGNVSLELTRENLMGNGSALMSVVGFSSLIVITRHTRKANLPMGRTLFYSWLVILIFILPLQIPYGHLPLTAANVVYGFLIGIVCTVMLYVLMNLGMRHINAGVASIVMFSEVVFTIANGAIFFSEPVSVYVGVGCLMIFAAIILGATEKPVARPCPQDVDSADS